MDLETPLTKRYPDSLKKLALKNLLHNGQTVYEVAAELDISRSTLYNWLSKERSSLKNSKNKFIATRLESELKAAKYERDVLVKAIEILLRSPNE